LRTSCLGYNSINLFFKKPCDRLTATFFLLLLNKIFFVPLAEGLHYYSATEIKR
jgi:hypothetical protein